MRLRVPSSVPLRLRLARGAFALFAALALLALVAFSAMMLASPTTDAGRQYQYARGAGGDYVLASVLDVPADHNVEAEWRASIGNKSPDRIMVVAAQDLDALFAGQAPEHVFRDTANASDKSYWSLRSSPVRGFVEVEKVHVENVLLDGGYQFPYACPSCQDDPRPAIVWMRGASWANATVTHGAWTLDASGSPTGDAPILVRAVSNEHNLLDWAPLLFFAILGLGGATLAAAAWWAIEAWLLRRARAREPPPPVGTEDLLRVVALSERYLAALSRSLLWGGLAVGAAVLVISFVVVPPLVAASQAHYPGADEPLVPIVLMPPFVGIVGIGLWLIAFARVREERARWARVSEGFRETTQRILE